MHFPNTIPAEVTKTIGNQPRRIGSMSNIQSTPSPKKTSAEAAQSFTEKLSSGEFDDMTIKEFRTLAKDHVGDLMSNDQTASIIGVVLLVVVT
jgi:hypothetical protein